MEAGSQVLQACGVGGVASSGQEAVGFASDDCVEGGPNLGDASRAREVSGDGLKGGSQALRRLVVDAERGKGVAVEGGVFPERPLGDFAE